MSLLPEFLGITTWQMPAHWVIREKMTPVIVEPEPEPAEQPLIACPYKEGSKREFAWRMGLFLQLMADGEAYTVKDIERRTKMRENRIRNTLEAMHKRGILDRSEPAKVGAHIPYCYWIPGDEVPETERTCHCCGETRPIRQFAKSGTSGRRSLTCCACYRKKKIVDLLPAERECCGTFPNTPHRATCEKFRGKKV